MCGRLTLRNLGEDVAEVFGLRRGCRRLRVRYFPFIVQPKWSPKESDALPLFNQPQVGEFSVRFLPPVHRYVMLYNAEKPRGINMRSAPNPWGPWSKETVIFDPWKDGGS